jgi:hypothetical protein
MLKVNADRISQIFAKSSSKNYFKITNVNIKEKINESFFGKKFA